MSSAPLILASSSPQRRAILQQLRVQFTVRAPEIRELEHGPPHEVAVENAYRKAMSVGPEFPGARVLAVDTVVCAGARIYGKPSGELQARETLLELAGRRHAVIGGVCVLEDGSAKTAACSTVVEFRALDRALIDWYLSTGEWRERAGGYAIQGRGAALVAGIEGDYYNVVGLPVPTLLELIPTLLSAG